MKLTLEGKAFPRLLMLFGSFMALSFGLISAFNPGFAHLNGFIPCRINPTPYVAYPPLWVKPPYYLTPWMVMSSIGGLLGLISFSMNDKKSISLSFAGTSLGLSRFLLFMYAFGTFPPFGTFDSTYLFIPWLGMSLTFLGVLMMFTGSVTRFHVMPRFLYVLVPSLASTLAYNILVVTNNIPYLLLIARSVHSHAIVGIPLLLTLLLISLGSILCLSKPLSPLSTKQ